MDCGAFEEEDGIIAIGLLARIGWRQVACVRNLGFGSKESAGSLFFCSYLRALSIMLPSTSFQIVIFCCLSEYIL